MKSKGNSINEPGAQTAGWRDQPGREVTNYTLTLEAVRKRAHEIREERGGLPENDLDDWIQAWRDLTEKRVL